MRPYNIACRLDLSSMYAMNMIYTHEIVTNLVVAMLHFLNAQVALLVFRTPMLISDVYLLTCLQTEGIYHCLSAQWGVAGGVRAGIPVAKG